MFFISVRNFKLIGSNLKTWFQKLQKMSILKRAALMILWGEEKIGGIMPLYPQRNVKKSALVHFLPWEF